MLTALLLVLAAPTCGAERQAVKTLQDRPALVLTVGTTTIRELRLRPVPQPFGNAEPRQPAETHVVEVVAQLVAYKLEADQDIHVVLQDGKRTMVVEYPDPACAPGATAHLPQLTAARTELLQLLPHPPTAEVRRLTPSLKVRVQGVVFFDKVHGQLGVAPNGVELHPVLRTQVVAP